MAVLDQATENLAATLTAMHNRSSSSSRPMRGGSGASGASAPDPAAQLQQLQSRVAQLQSHLMLWKQAREASKLVAVADLVENTCPGRSSISAVCTTDMI
jgi:hypothetical protein